MSLSDIQQALDSMELSAVDVPSEQVDSLRRLVSALTEQVSELKDELDRVRLDLQDQIDRVQRP